MMFKVSVHELGHNHAAFVAIVSKAAVRALSGERLHLPR